MRFYRTYGKRILDVSGAAVGLIMSAPLLVILSLVVRWQLGSPIFFRQRRPGLHGRPFELVKFRTMTDGRDPRGRLLPDDRRMTGFGHWLRRTSLDELPELINVLRGDMSLIGPRPLLMEYLPRYSPEQARRHEVRPGITGWAQVNGRNALDWSAKFAFDTWYVDRVGLALDLKILAKTVLDVLLRKGIAADGHATMPEFEGNMRVESTSGSTVLK